MNNIYCVCTTPEGFVHYGEYWNNFKCDNDLIIIADCTTGNVSGQNIFKFTEEQLRRQLNFNKVVPASHWWNSQNNRNITWFYAYLRMLNFYQQYPNYEYYWFFDDDAIITNSQAFFNGFTNDTSDFIAHFCFKNVGITAQSKVPVIDDNTYSKLDWFKRFPGNGDCMPKDAKDLFGSFFDVVRFSNEAMQYLLELNNKKFAGYGEGYVPTVLNAKGFELSTIIGKDNKSMYFDTDKVNIIHKGVKTDWQWI